MHKHDTPFEQKPSVPDLLWEKWALGEASLEEKRRIEQATTPEERAHKKAQLAQSNRAILEQYPADKMGADLRWRAQQSQRQAHTARRRSLWLGLPVAATAALAVTLWVAGPFREVPSSLPETDPVAQDAHKPPPATPPHEVVRVKGDPRLFLYRLEQDASNELKDQSLAHEGDRIQVKYLASGATHGVIFSVDGRGCVTLHFPESPTADSALVQGDAQALGRSYELDDAPEFERFYFVTSAMPIDVATVLQAAESSASGQPLVLSVGQQQTSLTLTKDSQL